MWRRYVIPNRSVRGGDEVLQRQQVSPWAIQEILDRFYCGSSWHIHEVREAG